MKEYVTWLAALISTDGCITDNYKARTITFRIYASEPDWLKVIQERLQEMGIYSTFHVRAPKANGKVKQNKPACHLTLWNGKKIAKMFVENDAKSFFNPRKWKTIEKAVSFYGVARNCVRYLPEEDEVILNNLDKPIKELQKLLPHKTYGSLWHRRRLLLQK